MLKKTITYQDFDNNTVSEEFHFHISKAELAKWQLSHEGGLEERIKKIVAAENKSEIIAIFEEIILKSVGIRSDDGKRFSKSDQIRDDFAQTNAYSELFMELVSDADAGVVFIRGIMPSDMIAEADKVMAEEMVVQLPESKAVVQGPEPETVTYTREELLAMPQEQFDLVVGKDPQKMKREHLVLAMQRRSQQ